MKWFVMLCAIWYHLYNLKNMKSTHEGVLLMAAHLLKVTLLHECFSRLLNFTSGTISRSASQGELTLLEKKVSGYSKLIIQ